MEGIQAGQSQAGSLVMPVAGRQPRTRTDLVAVFLCVIAVGAVDAFGDTLNVPREYPTVQAAVDAAAEGDTIVVARGVHAGEVRVVAKHRLRIKGRRGTRLVARTAGEPVLSLSGCSGIEIERLSIGDTDSDCVRISQSSSVVIDSCVLSDASGAGVVFQDAQSSVVRGCVIRNVDDGGVIVEAAQRILLHGNASIGVRTGILVRSSGGEESGSVVVAENSFVGCVDVAVRLEGPGHVVSRNRIRGGGNGISIEAGSSENRVERNMLRDLDGFGVILRGVGNVATGNRVVRARSPSLSIASGDLNLVAENRVSDGGGIFVTGDRNELSGNVVRRATGSGIFIDGVGNWATRNEVISAGLDGLHIVGADNRIVANASRGAGVVGFRVFGSGHELIGNTARGSRGDDLLDEAAAGANAYVGNDFRSVAE